MFERAAPPAPVCMAGFLCGLCLVIGGRAEEGQEQREALAGPGDQQRGKAIGRCKRSADPSCSAFCLLF